MAERMGFGQPTGIPIAGEAKGFLPTDAYYMQHEGTKILPGTLASIAIGQVVTATPLQVAQGMCGVADGVNQPKARLVKQVQDYNDNVVQAWPPEVRKEVNLQPLAKETVLRGMIAVVQGEGGTGHNAQISGIEVAGKTGTAQAHIDEDSSKNTWFAWFTGFMPARNPVYAFAVVYESAPGQHVSGGAIAAPIVQEVLEKINKHAKADDPLKLAALDSAKRAEPVDDGTVQQAPKAEPVKQAAPPPEQTTGIGGFFKRLFGRKN
jgi:penicillin-binding protein 2